MIVSRVQLMLKQNKVRHINEKIQYAERPLSSGIESCNFFKVLGSTLADYCISKGNFHNAKFSNTVSASYFKDFKTKRYTQLKLEYKIPLFKLSF